MFRRYSHRAEKEHIHLSSAQYNVRFSVTSRRIALKQFRRGPKVGDYAPDFIAYDLEGRLVRLSDFLGKKSIVLEFGSRTCPPAVLAQRSLGELSGKYSEKDFEFITVYTREAHPGERITCHMSFQDKMLQARKFSVETGNRTRILVDTLEGDGHRAYGLLANMIYVVNKEGVIIYRSDWTDTSGLEGVLHDLVRWKEFSMGTGMYRLQYYEGVRPLAGVIDRRSVSKLLSKAGRGAVGDTRWVREKGKPELFTAAFVQTS